MSVALCLFTSSCSQETGEYCIALYAYFISLNAFKIRANVSVLQSMIHLPVNSWNLLRPARIGGGAFRFRRNQEAVKFGK
jgi:hypothetical protein